MSTQDRFGKRIATVSSEWMTVNLDQVLRADGSHGDYWTVSKADSLVIVPYIGQTIFTTSDTYRHGARRTTRDFPGGRFREGQDVQPLVRAILLRECGESVGVSEVSIPRHGPWLIDSATLDSRLWVAFAALTDKPSAAGECRPHEVRTEYDLMDFLAVTPCLQCSWSAVLWWRETCQEDR